MTSRQSNADDRQLIHWAALDAGGWQYLVGSLNGAKIACVDSKGIVSAAAVGLGAQVTVLVDDEMCGNQVDRVMAIVGCSSYRVESIAKWMDRPSGGLHERYDGILWHDLVGDGINRKGIARLRRVIARGRALLQPNGFMYLAMRNAFSVDRLWKWGDASARGRLSISHVVGELRRAGFRDCRCHPFLIAGERLLEVVPPAGYVASKNPSSRAERVKKWLFSRLGARVLAPAYGIVAFPGTAGRSVMDDLLDRLWDTRFRATNDRDSVVVKQYLALNGGKVILGIGPKGSHGSDDVTAVLVKDTHAVERREREAMILEALSHLSRNLTRLVPRLLDQFTFEGARCFVLSHLPGATLDRDLPELIAVTDGAFEYLLSFHQETKRIVTVDPTNFKALFSVLFDSARRCNPGQLEELSVLEDLVRARVSEVELPTVWAHGDFKVENVMYDPSRLTVTGVIDWELSRNPGLPMLDLLYLQFYNRLIRGMDWVEAFRGLCLTRHLDAVEQKHQTRYLDMLMISDKWVSILNVMFLVHHLGCRMQLILSDRREQEQVNAIMRECIQLLKDAASSATYSRAF